MSLTPLISVRAFTLAEVLIALVLLGVVAAFTIPKVLQNSNNQKRNAVIKETVGAFNQLSYQGVLTGELKRSNCNQYFVQKLNVLKDCVNTADTSCFVPTAGFDAKAVLLASGVAIGDIDGCPGFNADGSVNNSDSAEIVQQKVIIDWNGPAAPNALCDDQFHVYFNVGSKADTFTGTLGEFIAPGSVYVLGSNTCKQVFKAALTQ